MHWLLYLLLFVLPILGWINASYRGLPIVMFGLELPKLVAQRAPGWGWTGDVHSLLANYALLALVGLHVAGRALSLFLRSRRRAAADAAGAADVLDTKRHPNSLIVFYALAWNNALSRATALLKIGHRKWPKAQ